MHEAHEGRGVQVAENGGDLDGGLEARENGLGPGLEEKHGAAQFVVVVEFVSDDVVERRKGMMNRCPVIFGSGSIVAVKDQVLNDKLANRVEKGRFVANVDGFDGDIATVALSASKDVAVGPFADAFVNRIGGRRGPVVRGAKVLANGREARCVRGIAIGSVDAKETLDGGLQRGIAAVAFGGGNIGRNRRTRTFVYQHDDL